MNSHQSPDEQDPQVELDWPKNGQFYLTLDLECDFGTALGTNTYESLPVVDSLVELLEAYKIPLTCFVQTEILDDYSETVEALQACAQPVSFHPHSHTHQPRERADVADEIATSTSKYRDFFDTEPVGYRLPNGNVRSSDYQHLAEYGYEFDASVFPSWRPNHFNNASAPTVPQYLPAHDLFEIPFTVYSDWLRIPTALSYNRLLRWPSETLLRRRPPSVIVYNIHLHDLVVPSTRELLPTPYKVAYPKTDNGLSILDRVLDAFTLQDYSFELLDGLHETLRGERERAVQPR